MEGVRRFIFIQNLQIAMIKKFLKITFIFYFISLCIIPNITASLLAASEDVTQQEESTPMDEKEAWRNFWDNLSNAKISDEDIQKFNDEYLNGEDAFDISKKNLSKFLNNLKKAEYDKDDFNGNADKVYNGFIGFVEKVINEGVIDGLRKLGRSIANFFVNIIGAIAKSAV